MGIDSASNRPAPARETRTITGPHLIPPLDSVARGIWLAAVLGMLALTIAGIGPRYNNLVEKAREVAPQLGQLGVSQGIYIGVNFGFGILSLVLYLAIAALIFWRRSDDWVALFVGLVMAATGMNSSLFAEALIKGNPGIAVLADFPRAISENFALVPLVFFPDGRAQPRWMKWPAVLILGYGILRPFFYYTPFHSQQWPGWLLAVWFLLTLGVGTIALAYRYIRHSTPAVRQQLKWLIYSQALTIFTVILLKAMPSFVPALAEPSSGPTTTSVLWSLWDYAIYSIVVIPIPIGFVFSILRYRLWDIDFVINKTLVYGFVTALLAVVFGVSLLAMNQVIDMIPGAHAIPGIGVVVSALVVGTLFQPTRTRVRRFVDRRFYHIEIDYKKALANEAEREKKVILRSGDTLASFSNYSEIQLLGRGGMGEVYRAQHPTLHRLVAIKLLPQALSNDNYARRRFMREAQAVARLKHPNIIAVQDFGEADGVPYMVMDFLQGHSLAQILKSQGVLPLADTRPILEEIANALDYAHEQGVIHRDVKPSNVMIEPVSDAGSTRKTRAILMDFGIAKVASDVTSKLTVTGVIGTLDYISPEQIQGASDVDGRADIYSLGVMTYQVLTGQLPFLHSNPAAILIAHLMEPPADPTTINRSLSDRTGSAILRALSKRPEDRYATAGDFVAALAA